MKLSDIFSHFTQVRDSHKVYIKQAEREHNLSRLESWLDETREKIAADLEKEDPKTLLSYSIDVDTSTLTQDDIQKIAPKITALHDECMERNIKLDIGGFSRLPSVGVGATENSWTRGPAVEIAVTPSKPYNIYRHPLYGARDAAKKRPKLGM